MVMGFLMKLKNQGTSPYNADTDGDGKSDNEEIGYGSNPLDVNHPNNQNQSSSAPTRSVAELIEAKDSKGLSQVLREGVKTILSLIPTNNT